MNSAAMSGRLPDDRHRRQITCTSCEPASCQFVCDAAGAKTTAGKRSASLWLPGSEACDIFLGLGKSYNPKPTSVTGRKTQFSTQHDAHFQFTKRALGSHTAQMSGTTPQHAGGVPSEERHFFRSGLKTEVSNHDSKQHLGFEEPQGWSRRAVKRTAPLACCCTA